MIAGGTPMIMVFAAPMATRLEATFRGLAALAKTLAVEVAGAFGIPLLLLCVAAVAGNFVKHRFVFSIEPIKPQLSRISPAAGLGRLFSGQALANFAKGLAKLGVVGAVMGAEGLGRHHQPDSLCGRVKI